MFRRNNKTRKYQTPYAKVTHMALESNFCNTVLFNAELEELKNMNLEVDEEVRGTAEDGFYFDF